MPGLDPSAIAPIVPIVQQVDNPPPLARQVPGGAEGPVMTPQDQGAPTVPRWFQPPIRETPAPVVQPTPITSRRPSMASATEAADIATKSGYDTAAAQEAIGPAKVAEKEGNAAAQQKMADQQAANAAEIARTQQAQQDGLTQARELSQRANEEYKNFKFHDYWEDKPTSEHLKAQIFSGLGEFAAILSGSGRNQAAMNIKSLIDRDFEKQKLKMSSLQEFAKMRQEGVISLEGQYKNNLALLGLKQAAAYNAVADEAKAQAIRNGEAPEQAENNVLVKQIRQKADELRAKNEADLEKARAQLAMAGMKAAPNQPADPNVLAMLAKLAEKPGVTQADVYAAAARAGIKNSNKELQPIIDNVNSQGNKREAAEEKLKERTINVGNGETLVAPTARQVNAIQTQAANYDDALESLKERYDEIKDNPGGKGLPFGAKHARAGLAVSAVTTANSSDATTRHEFHTIQDSLNLDDAKSILDTMRHVKERRDKFFNAYRAKPSEGEPSGNSGESKKPGSASHPVGTIVSSGGKKYRVTSEDGDIEEVQ